MRVTWAAVNAAIRTINKARGDDRVMREVFAKAEPLDPLDWRDDSRRDLDAAMESIRVMGMKRMMADMSGYHLDAFTFEPHSSGPWIPARLRPTDRTGATFNVQVVEVATCPGCPGHDSHVYFRPRMWPGSVQWMRDLWAVAGHKFTGPSVAS